MSTVAIQTKVTEMLASVLSSCHQLMADSSTDFRTVEQTIMSGFMSAAAETIGFCLSQHDIDSPYVTYDGKRYEKSSTGTATYFTCAGKVRVTRSLYRCPLYGRSICPLNLTVGIVQGTWTPQAAKVATLATAEMTPYAAAALFQEIGAMVPSKSSLDRLPKRIDRSLSLCHETVASQVREHRPIPEAATKVAVSLDGVHVPIQKLKGKKRYRVDQGFSETRGTQYLIEEDYSRYREASCGSVSYLNNQGDVLQTQYYGRMPEEHKRVLKNRLEAHVKEDLDRRPDLEVVAIADGAKDNWTFFDDKFPDATKILDFYHAAEHLKKAIDSIYPNSNTAAELFKKKRSQLRHDPKGIDKVIKFLQIHYRENANEELRCEINYFISNRERCHYYHNAQQNNPIGSGIIEAACKSLVAKRLKCSGMAWRWEGGQAILNFRAYLKSNLFDELWDVITPMYKQPVYSANS